MFLVLVLFFDLLLELQVQGAEQGLSGHRTTPPLVWLLDFTSLTSCVLTVLQDQTQPPAEVMPPQKEKVLLDLITAL